jgi:hypothetical protein
VGPFAVAVAVAVVLALSATASGAGAYGPAGTNPVQSLPIGPLPAACTGAPDGAVCVNAVVAYLDRARADLGQPAYALPADFTSLAADQQALILTDLDRAQYGLAPITGLTSDLDQAAAAGAAAGSDPQPDPAFGEQFTANEAVGQTNIVEAYYEWMYDDGSGSPNTDCGAPGHTGCWGHREDVLWSFAGVSGPAAMGAAAGVEAGGARSFALLLGVGTDGYPAAYTYTWAQAVADGATTNVYDPGPDGGSRGPPNPAGSAYRLRIISIRVSGHTVHIVIAAPPAPALRCSLASSRGRGWRRTPFALCGTAPSYARVPRGRYRFTVRDGFLTATAVLTVS